MVRILALVPRVIPSQGGAFVGGAVNSAIRQFQALPSKYEVTLVTGVPGEAATRLRSGMAPAGITVAPVEVNQRMSGWTWGFVYTLKIIRESYGLHKDASFELVHGHSGHPMYAVATYLAGQLLGIPTVHTLYCPFQVDSNLGSYPLTGIRWLGMVFNQLNAVIGISQNIVDSLQRAGVDGSIVTFLPPIMDVRRFNPNVSTQAAARQKIGLPQAKPIILYIGNLIATKGIDVLLNAVPLILSQKPSCRFVFTFDLDLKDSASERKRKMEVLQRIKELGLQDHIKCMGIVHDIPRLLIAADVVVAPFLSTIGPSDYPLALLEAMAVGRAVVSTSVGGIPEIIDQGQTGVLVSPGDAQELAEAVANLLSDSDYRHQIGQRAASFLRQTFDARVVSSQHEQLYAKIVQERRR